MHHRQTINVATASLLIIIAFSASSACAKNAKGYTREISAHLPELERAAQEKRLGGNIARRIRYYALDPHHPDLIRGLTFRPVGAPSRFYKMPGEIVMPWSRPIGRYVVPFAEMPYIVRVVPDPTCAGITLTYSIKLKALTDYFCS
jgi:hypothetical protein